MGIRFLFGWYLCKATADTFDDLEWCENQFGLANKADRWWYEGRSNTFYFKSEKDAIWFTLKWG